MREACLVRSLPLFAVLLVCPAAAKAEPDHDRSLQMLALRIEALGREYPQLAQFSARRHLHAAELRIDYAFRTHPPAPTGGWTSGVPEPDADGIWFHIDLHDPESTLALHTQPVVATRLRFGNKVAYLLIREGGRTKPVGDRLWTLVREMIAEPAPEH
jgi:hypothetical protein